MDIEQVYKQYAMKVYKYLLVLTKNPELAEELTAETFYRAMKTHKSFRGDCKVLTWLCQIAKYSFYDELRKRGNLKIESIDDEYIEVEDLDYMPEKILIDLDDKVKIYKVIRRLNEDVREVMYLRLLTDLNFREIGEILNRSENWCRVNFYRSKIKLKEELEKDE